MGKLYSTYEHQCIDVFHTNYFLIEKEKVSEKHSGKNSVSYTKLLKLSFTLCPYFLKGFEML